MVPRTITGSLKDLGHSKELISDYMRKLKMAKDLKGEKGKSGRAD
jgi:hypothetical protein